MNKVSFTWHINIFVGERWSCHERDLTMDEFKDISFLDQVVDGENAIVI